MASAARSGLRFGLIGNALGLTCLITVGARGSASLQQEVNSLMMGRRGAVLASNPATGDLLAVWNRSVAFGQAFPIGSTAKVVTAAAGLEEGMISPGDSIYCRGTPEILGEAYHCSHPPSERPFTLASALANSCNYFFVQLSLRLSSSRLAHWYEVFGFGSPPPGAGAGATAGEIRVGDTTREKALAALGEKTTLASPAQLLLAYSGIATGGAVVPFRHSAGSQRPAAIIRRINLQPQTFEILKSALIECVDSGSGQAAKVEGIRVAGKTGTATAVDGSRTTHAWFVGYAPAGNPQIAVVIFLRRGTGGRDAAPLAGKILAKYFESKDRKK